MALIVSAEDDPDIQLVIRIGLERAGHTVRSVNDGAEALRIVRQERPNLVILDIDMPKLTGLEVCAAIRADPTLRDIPVVIASGSIRPPYETVTGIGANDVLPKPFTLADLVRIAAKHLDCSPNQRTVIP